MIFCVKEREKGKSNEEIKVHLIESGLDSKMAQSIILKSEGYSIQKPNSNSAVFLMLAGLVVCAVGIGITVGSGQRVIAYGAIIVGAIWFFRGLSNLA